MSDEDWKSVEKNPPPIGMRVLTLDQYGIYKISRLAVTGRFHTVQWLDDNRGTRVPVCWSELKRRPKCFVPEGASFKIVRLREAA